MSFNVEKTVSEANGGSQLITYKFTDIQGFDGFDPIIRCQNGRTVRIVWTTFRPHVFCSPTEIQTNKEKNLMSLINQIDAAAPYTCEAEYLADRAQLNHYDGGLRAAIERRLARSPKITLAPAPPKAPLKSWSANPGRFPTTNNNETTNGDQQ